MISISYNSTHTLSIDCECKHRPNGKTSIDLQLMLLDKSNPNLVSWLREWTLKDGLWKCCHSTEDEIILKLNEQDKQIYIDMYNNNESLLDFYKWLW